MSENNGTTALIQEAKDVVEFVYEASIKATHISDMLEKLEQTTSTKALRDDQLRELRVRVDEAKRHLRWER